MRVYAVKFLPIRNNMKKLFLFIQKIFVFLFGRKEKEQIRDVQSILPKEKEILPLPQKKKKEKKWETEPNYFSMPNISMALKRKNIQQIFMWDDSTFPCRWRMKLIRH